MILHVSDRTIWTTRSACRRCREHRGTRKRRASHRSVMPVARQAAHNARVNDPTISDAAFNAAAATIRQTLALACGY
jgi:hypothetical protein